jgi:retron-type reverse transcriptase
MSGAKIGKIIAAMRGERYRFAPVRRVYIPKKNGKLRPLGLPSWSDKLVGEVVRLLLEAYYEPAFSDHSHGFRKGRGCHTALRKVQETWTGTVWFIEGDEAYAKPLRPDCPLARHRRSQACLIILAGSFA